MDNRENTGPAGQNQPAAAQTYNAADNGARAKEAHEVSNTSPVGGGADSGIKNEFPKPGTGANANNERLHATNTKDEADSAEDNEPLDDAGDEDWWEDCWEEETGLEEEPSREEVLLGQLAESCCVLDASSDPDESLVFDINASYLMAEVDNNDDEAPNDKAEGEVTTLRNPQAAWQPPVELCEFRRNQVTYDSIEIPEETGTIRQLKTLPGYRTNNSTGALIRVLGRQIFSKFPCYAAFRDGMCKNGVDALGEVWMAEYDFDSEDEQNRKAMGDILRRYQLVAQIEPARVSAGQLSFSVMEGYLPKIGLVVTDNTSILFVHENEENGCPRRRVYLYAWPRKEETRQKAASLSELAEQDENSIVHLLREIPANEFFAGALNDLQSH